MRDYQQTHPWLKFKLDLNRFSAELWMALGEAKSKCEHIAGVPLTIPTAKKLHQVYLAKGAHATTAIEGNTLTEEEVLARLEGKSQLSASKEYLGQEIDNICEAFNWIKNQLEKTGSEKLSVEAIKEYNRLVLQNLSLDSQVVPGEIRTYSVGVEMARYRGAPAQDCEFLLENMCKWLNREFTPSDERLKLPFGLIKAIVAHIYLAWIHPFGDGNGRTARLIEFQVLLTSGVPLPASLLLSNHYNQTRQEYYRQLKQASESGGDLISFITYAVNGFVDELTDALQEIRKQQWMISWQDYIYQKFEDKNKKADRRRRQLVLDLSRRDEPYPLSKVRDLSPRVAVNYASLTDATIHNDINELKKMDLIERKDKMIWAKMESILAFLPWKMLEKNG